MALEYQVGAVTQHQGGTDRGQDVYDNREHGLAHGKIHPRGNGTLALLAETLVVVRFQTKGDDHPQHRHRLVYYRERFAFHPPHLDQPGLDSPGVVASRVVDKRYHRYHEQG